MAVRNQVGQVSLGVNLDSKPMLNQAKSLQSTVAGIGKKLGAALVAGLSVKALVGFSKKCIELGSDLSEVQNVVDVTFTTMNKKVDEFAKGAAASFGLSETMAKRYTGTFGAMSKAFGFTEQQAYDMSTTLTGLAGDVASFYNIGQDEAYTKLKSVFSGETESLKDLGVVMTQSALDQYALANGFGKTTAKMSEQEKVALRYNFVLSNLSLAQGDFSRTSDSWANQTRLLKLQFDQLKATIGQGLINALVPVLKVINQLLGKLMTLANAFKSFTEMLTGKKSTAGSGISEMASATAEAASGADGLSDSVAGAGDAAKKAAKEMRSLMSFDQINKLQELSEDAADENAGSGIGAGIGSSNVDMGGLAKGETFLDKINDKFKDAIEKAKELAELFKQGFKAGSSSVNLEPLKNAVKGIRDSLTNLVNDPEIQGAAGRFVNTLAYSFGQQAGAVYSIGVTIATNIAGGVNKYLQENSPRIKNWIINVFDIASEIETVRGNLAEAIANIFSVFGGENGQTATANFIGIFADAFMGVTELSLMFTRDIEQLLYQPIIDNQEKLKVALDGTLGVVSSVLGTIKDLVDSTVDKLLEVYNEHVKPLFDSLTTGISEIVGTLVDGYNKYMKPVLDRLAELWDSTVKEHIQPMIDTVIEYVGKVADVIKGVWETVLQPLLNWIAGEVFPRVAPIVQRIGALVLAIVGNIVDRFRGLMRILGGLIDFIAGVFSGDWERAWNGIKEIFGGIWDRLANGIKIPINLIIGWINGLLQRVESMANTIAQVFNNIRLEIPDWVPGMGGGTLGFNLPEWDIPEIPYLAQGGYVRPNAPQLAMIGDNRHQGEVVAPENKIRELAGQAFADHAEVFAETIADKLQDVMSSIVMAVGAGKAQGQDIVLMVDAVEIARASIKGSEELNWRMHPTVKYS